MQDIPVKTISADGLDTLIIEDVFSFNGRILDYFDLTLRHVDLHITQRRKQILFTRGGLPLYLCATLLNHSLDQSIILFEHEGEQLLVVVTWTHKIFMRS